MKKNIIGNIKKLREDTGLGMLECKMALEATEYDIEAAKIYLRKRGHKSRDRGFKPTPEGSIGVYSHIGGRITAMVEVNCETDFAARSPDFQNFTYSLAMHVVALNPKWVSKKDVPKNILDREIDILSTGLDNKPDDIKEKIILGRLNKFYKNECLLEQSFVKDSKLTINDLLSNLTNKIKENISIKRFSRFEVGSE